MKTFSRVFWEGQYRVLCQLNMAIPLYLPFSKVLTGDTEEVMQIIKKLPYPPADTMSELIRNVLSEINDYGHSLVLMLSDDNPGYEPAEITDTLGSAMRDLVVNVAAGDSCIRMQGVNALIRFGNKLYECKHISTMGAVGGYEFYVPLDGSKRIFISSHCKKCKGCKKKSCIRDNRNPSIKMYSSLIGDLVKNPPAPYDLHTAECDAKYVAEWALANVITAIKKYNESSSDISVAVVEDAASDAAAEKTKRTGSSASRGRKKQELSNLDEIIVPVNKYKSSQKHVGKGGTHASPSAHVVSGFWRRRSKYDNTLIFVKSFARGGTAEERKEISSGLGVRQKVYKV